MKTIESYTLSIGALARSVLNDYETFSEGNMSLDDFIFETDRVIGWIKEDLKDLSELADRQVEQLAADVELLDAIQNIERVYAGV